MPHVLTLVHPAAILRGQWALAPYQVQSLKRLRRWLDEPTFRREWPTDMLAPLPEAQANPSLDDLLEWMAALPHTSPEGIAVDIEGSDPIRLVGIARLSDEDYRPVLLLSEGGVPAWNDHDRDALLRALDRTFRSVPLIMQNGQAYDVPELEEVGFDASEMYLAGGDTIIMARYAYPEAPAGLEFLGITFGLLSAWKWQAHVREDDAQEGK